MSDKTLPDDEIHLVKTLQEDNIYYNPAFQYRADFFHAWKIYNGSRLTEYFNKKSCTFALNLGSHNYKSIFRRCII
ncbi:MAG: DUF6794 domain-containing protein [Chitinophagaceae bacterium]